MILAATAVVYKMLRRKTVLIVDRHSNFFPISNLVFINKIHEILSKVTIKKADMTIVTNTHLKAIVDNSGGYGVVLEDKVPLFHKGKEIELAGKYNILFICSFDPDEPIKEVFEAAKMLDPDVYIYVTGNYKKIKLRDLINNIPKNIRLTGFLTETDYVDYLYAADAVIVLTQWDHTLLCGAYEAVAAEKPIILSDKDDLLAYFRHGTVKVQNSAQSIAAAINETIRRKDFLTKEIVALKSKLNQKWDEKFDKVRYRISKMCENDRKGK
jgi:glycosyltransferase involved in cell wall biosynthesis